MTIIGEEMKPCPFCGSGDLALRADCYVHCRACGADGPVDDDESEQAASLWNTRSPEAVTDEMREAGADHIGGGSTFDRDERLEMAEEIYEAMRDAALLKVTR